MKAHLREFSEIDYTRLAIEIQTIEAVTKKRL